MIAAFSRRMLHKLMHKRAERHAGCRIDAARLKVDPEYASAIRALARFTLDEELRTLGAMIERGEMKVREQRYQGLEAAPQAFVDLFTDNAFGRRIIAMGAEAG